MIHDMVDVLRTVIAERSGVYVSAPVTSGKRFFILQEALRADGSSAAEIDASTLAHNVIEPNIAETVALVHAARERFGFTVIDPSPLVVPDWEQDHYVVLWGAILRRYARLVVFSDGWELSSGCTYEFVVACNEGIPAVDARFEPLSRNRGAELIANAKAELDVRGLDAPYLEERLDDLRGTRSHPARAFDPGLNGRSRSTLCSLMLGTVAMLRTAIVVCSPAGAAHAEFVGELRSRGKLVIDLAAFVPATWSREELRELWSRVIAVYAAEVALGPGWESSADCAAEFYAAVKAGVAVASAKGQPIMLEEAIAAFAAAIAASHERGVALTGLRHILRMLEELRDAE